MGSRRKDPINQIEWVPADTLHANAWNPNRVMTPELVLLERSILTTGWVQPILVNADGQVIDGFHRWRLSQDSKALRTRYKGDVPVARLHVDEPTAMAITVRMNRAKGHHGAVQMAALAHSIIGDHGWTREQLATEIGATATEVDLLLQDGVFTAKGTADWAYSPAWYPVPAADANAPADAVPERDDDPADVDAVT